MLLHVSILLFFVLPNNVPFYGYITFAYAFISWCTLQLFLLFGYLNNILWKYKFFMNTYFHFSSWELLGHMLTSKFLKNCLFPIWLQYFTFPLAVYESSKFSTLMLTLFCLFDYSILLGIKWCLIVVWFIFSEWLMTLSIFSCDYWPFIYLLHRNDCSNHFLIGLFTFLFLSCKSYLYILDLSLLLNL